MAKRWEGPDNIRSADDGRGGRTRPLLHKAHRPADRPDRVLFRFV